MRDSAPLAHFGSLSPPHHGAAVGASWRGYGHVTERAAACRCAPRRVLARPRDGASRPAAPGRRRRRCGWPQQILGAHHAAQEPGRQPGHAVCHGLEGGRHEQAAGEPTRPAAAPPAAPHRARVPRVSGRYALHPALQCRLQQLCAALARRCGCAGACNATLPPAWRAFSVAAAGAERLPAPRARRWASPPSGTRATAATCTCWTWRPP